MEDEEEEEEEDELPMGYKEHSAHGARDAAGPSEDVEPPEDGPDGDLFDDGTGPTEPNEHGAKVLPEEEGTGEDALYPEETTVEPIGPAGSEGDEIIAEPGMTERNENFALDGAPEEVLTPAEEESGSESRSTGHGPKHRPGARHAVGHTTEEGSVKLALTTHKNFRAS